MHDLLVVWLHIRLEDVDSRCISGSLDVVYCNFGNEIDSLCGELDEM